MAGAGMGGFYQEALPPSEVPGYGGHPGEGVKEYAQVVAEGEFDSRLVIGCNV